MRAVIASIGTTGDVAPMVALASAMLRKSHQVTLALPPNYADLAGGIGARFVPVGYAITDGFLGELLTTLRPLLLDAQIASVFRQILRAVPDTFTQLCREVVGADVLIATTYQPAGRMVHDATGIPFVSVHLGPVQVQAGPPSSPLALIDVELNALRRRYGLSTLDNPSGRGAISERLVLHAVSRVMLAKTSDAINWDRPGFFFLDNDRVLPEAVQSFVESGDAPFIVTFGSMVQDRQQLIDIVSWAARATGLRSILQLSWGGGDVTVDDLSTAAGGVLICGAFPHAALLPHASVVVHHAGAGTCAATLRAGVPSIAVPHALDQPIWAHRLREIGCAPSMILRSRFSGPALAAALVEAVESDRWRAAAERAAAVIRGEEGVDGAVRLIDRFLNE